jgi:acylphosphatase
MSLIVVRTKLKYNMKRAEITVKGDVQRVGYRDVVVKIARKLKVTGFVENLKPYDAKIISEGEEDTLGEFITQIRIDKPPISVEAIDVEFEAATHEFEYFEIRRGDWREELGERLDTAGAMLYRSVELGERSVELGEKMLEKQDTHTHVLTNLCDQTQQNFVMLDIKYGRISDNMEKLIDEMRSERKESRTAMENLTEAIIRRSESKK